MPRNVELLVETTRDWLDEKTRANREGVALPDTIEQLSKYVFEDTGELHFMHFSTINKLGINPMSDFWTPLGIYGYPITNRTVKELSKGELPFATDRDYIHIFKPSDDAYEGLIMIRSTTQGLMDGAVLLDYMIKMGTDDQFKALEYIEPFKTYRDQFSSLYKNGQIKHLFDASREIPLVKRAFDDSKWNTNLGAFWNLTRHLTRQGDKKKSNRAWSRVLRMLGFTGVIDLGVGFVHSAEPSQGVFFSKAAVEQIDMILNKERPVDQDRRYTRKMFKHYGIEWAMYRGTEVVFTSRFNRLVREQVLSMVDDGIGLDTPEDLEARAKGYWHYGIYEELGQDAYRHPHSPDPFKGDYTMKVVNFDKDAVYFKVENSRTAPSATRFALYMEDVKGMVQPVEAMNK